ncbi:SDR family oxidoreductase [Streptomyces sp. NBC_01283]|uniref:SDR family NAD(P)-dependent oxidoreductase n=1 Tax=Streptomyces sp. NBC_01283 TaxID=2903812 RepID=UPI00352FADB5|nr:SDR family oxidoreductase [Streptomyces sp. NBC_01283]WSL21350.1 SDR family oxidoreductase [Streptomyces sp. NBC_01283]
MAIDFGLEGSVAIVTGGGSRASGVGNGRAAAVLLAEAGAHVVVVDSAARNMAETRSLMAERGKDALLVTADVTSPQECADVVARTWDTFGRLDILVNNVGVAGPPGTVVDLDLHAWDQCLGLNLTSMMLMSRAAIPRMRTGGGGSIVNMSSAVALVGGHPEVAYPTTKAAVIGLTKTMAAHHGPEGIRVNAIAPGYVYTPMVHSQGVDDGAREQRRQAAPLGIEGTGWDVGDAVLFLAGPRSRWITGAVLPVDAGLTATLGLGGAPSVTSVPGPLTAPEV